MSTTTQHTSQLETETQELYGEAAEYAAHEIARHLRAGATISGDSDCLRPYDDDSAYGGLTITYPPHMRTVAQTTSPPATHPERLDGPVYVEVMDTAHGLRIAVCVSVDADSCARIAGQPLTELQLYSTGEWLHDTVRELVVAVRGDVCAAIKDAVQPRLPNPIVHAFEGPTSSSPTAVLIPCGHAVFPAGSTVYINGGVVSYTVLQSGTLGADADAEPHYALFSALTGETHGPVPQSALTTTNGAA